MDYEKDIFDKSADGVEPAGKRTKSLALLVNEAKLRRCFAPKEAKSPHFSRSLILISSLAKRLHSFISPNGATSLKKASATISSVRTAVKQNGNQVFGISTYPQQVNFVIAAVLMLISSVIVYFELKKVNLGFKVN